MAETYVAKAAVVKVSIGPADGNRVARIIRAGGVIPEGVDKAAIAALLKRGLIKKLPQVPEAQEAADKAAAEAKAKAAAEAKAKAEADQAEADAKSKVAAEAAAKKAATK